MKTSLLLISVRLSFSYLSETFQVDINSPALLPSHISKPVSIDSDSPGIKRTPITVTSAIAAQSLRYFLVSNFEFLS